MKVNRGVKGGSYSLAGIHRYGKSLYVFGRCQVLLQINWSLVLATIRSLLICWQKWHCKTGWKYAAGCTIWSTGWRALSPYLLTWCLSVTQFPTEAIDLCHAIPGIPRKRTVGVHCCGIILEFFASSMYICGGEARCWDCTGPADLVPQILNFQ